MCMNVSTPRSYLMDQKQMSNNRTLNIYKYSRAQPEDFYRVTTSLAKLSNNMDNIS